MIPCQDLNSQRLNLEFLTTTYNLGPNPLNNNQVRLARFDDWLQQICCPFYNGRIKALIATNTKNQFTPFTNLMQVQTMMRTCYILGQSTVRCKQLQFFKIFSMHYPTAYLQHIWTSLNGVLCTRPFFARFLHKFGSYNCWDLANFLNLSQAIFLNQDSLNLLLTWLLTYFHHTHVTPGVHMSQVFKSLICHFHSKLLGQVGRQVGCMSHIVHRNVGKLGSHCMFFDLLHKIMILPF